VAAAVSAVTALGMQAGDTLAVHSNWGDAQLGNFRRRPRPPPDLPLDADARGKRPGIVRQEAAVEAAGLVGDGNATIDVEVPVDGVIDQEGALIEVA